MVNYIDIKLTNISDAVDKVGYYDISLDSDGDLSKVSGFDTNIIMSMFSERRASSSEVVDPLLRRGWWGNTLSDSPGFEDGSKLWLLEQARLTSGTISLAQQYTLDGLRWLKDDGYVYDVQVDVQPSYSSVSGSGVAITVNLVRKDNTVEYKYYSIWELTGR